ncbi:uncharacterized protein LOC135935545 [Cloeon dipterum]|uniref:uncharacterized protein LOC135935545 n=1 Tax=Cloeon dipterum TaxID=197152 RepID=UPI00321FFC90
MDVPRPSSLLSKGSLVRVVKNEPLALPIFLQVLNAQVVPVVNSGKFYRLWLFDGTYKTSFGLISYEKYWASKIDLEMQTGVEKVAIIRVNKIRCQTLDLINRPAIYLDSVNVEEYTVVEDLHAATDLDECFKGELEHFDLTSLSKYSANSIKSEIKPLMSITLKSKEELNQQMNARVKCNSQLGCLNAVDAQDSDLASQGLVRARLTFMSPLIWKQQGYYRRLTFTTKYFKISGTITQREEQNCDLPKVNEGCLLKNIPEEKENALFERIHFGGPASTESLPEIKYNFMPLHNVRALATDSVCDLIGVLSAPPKKKNFGKDTKKMVLNICDPTCKFDLPVEVWPAALEGLDLNDNPVIAVCGARRTSLTMSYVALRADSMLLVNPDWLKECKKLKKWWNKKEDDVNYDTFNEVRKILEKNSSIKEFIVPKLTVENTMESLNFDIRCTLCSEMAYDLAQPTFVCVNCGPIVKVVIENIRTSLQLHDGTNYEWVLVKDQQIRSLLGLPSPLYGEIDNPELYTKVTALKERQIRARIKYAANLKMRYILLEAQYTDEYDSLVK